MSTFAFLRKVFFSLACTSMLVVFLTLKIAAQAPGEVSPQAKILDADQLWNFQDGVAKIQKGSSFALINGKGEIIVPFNKYSSIEHGQRGSNILIVELGNRKKGLINTKGMEILPCRYENIFGNFDAEGYLLIHPPISEKEPLFFINSEGKRIVISPTPTLSFPANGQGCSEGLCPIYQYQSAKTGFADRTGKVVIPPQFNLVELFSEGLACVGKANEFGETKYGFIDKQGKVVIPIQFSNKPTNFSSGLALVTPVKKDEFNYAYINRQGQVMYKIKNAPNGKELFLPSGSTGNFVNGYAEWASWVSAYEQEIYWIDTLGKVVAEKNYLASHNIDSKSHERLKLGSATSSIIQVRGKTIYNNTGFIDMRTKKMLPIIFNVNHEDNFDPISKLVKSSRFDTQQLKKTLEGFINEEGIYVIIKGEGNKW